VDAAFGLKLKKSPVFPVDRKRHARMKKAGPLWEPAFIAAG